MARTLLLCSCGGSQAPDGEAIAAVTGIACSRLYSALCTSQSDQAAQAIAGGEAMIACTQERVLFGEMAADAGVGAPDLVDLRDRAGWSDEAGDGGPKMAALVAEALLSPPPTHVVDVVSAGSCLIVGPGAAVDPLARQLCDALAVTALFTDAADPPADRAFDAIRGRVRRLGGALGGFGIEIDGLCRAVPVGRGGFGFDAPRDGAQSGCDIVIDLTGGPAMVPAPDKREGYLRADPRDALAVARLGLAAVQLVGTFEKPLHVRTEDLLCAHSRAGLAGCSRCLEVCPTGAIAPLGDHVAVDAMVCAGCGSCAAVCPSSAVSWQAPPFSHLLKRIEVLARSYRAAGGTAPRLLVHDGHGAEMIALAARFGRGLPAAVIALAVPAVSGFGHAEMLAALAHGFACVQVLLSPGAERDALVRELALAQAIAGAGRLALIDEADPDALSDVLYATRAPAPLVRPVLPLGNRRQVARLAAQALNPAVASLSLPEGAPYGAVRVDTGACTLCLACVSLCPSGALLDNPDAPQLRFQEDACLQCGICAAACPERAMTLEPRLNLGTQALAQVVLNEEEPFACVECGKPFGVRSTVERIVEKLVGRHPMFAGSAQARMIAMCEDCRVNAQIHGAQAPFAGADRARPRTAED